MTTIRDIHRTAHGWELDGLEVAGLTPRESQAFLLRAKGNSVAECARIMNCSAANIKQRIGNLFYKLHANSMPELVTKAFESKIARCLCMLLALHVGISAPFFDDQYTARPGRVRTRQRNCSTRIREGSLVWLPETNQLIIV